MGYFIGKWILVSIEKGFQACQRVGVFSCRSVRPLAFAILLFLVGCGGGGGEPDGLVSPNPTTGVVDPGPGKATLIWEAPTTNADGTSLEDLSGFRVYYGKTTPLSKFNSQGIGVDNTTTYTLSRLEPGTYHFAVAALDMDGNESDLSEEASHVVQ